MCGTLKHNNKKYRQGDQVTGRVYRTGDVTIGTWSGFIKQERLDWWLNQTQLKPIEVNATAFVEGKNEFEVPSGCILAYQLMGNVVFNDKLIGKPGDIKILTREPLNTFERALHLRWPVVKVGKKRETFAFQPWDVKYLSPARQMNLPIEDVAE